MWFQMLIEDQFPLFVRQQTQRNPVIHLWSPIAVVFLFGAYCHNIILWSRPFHCGFGGKHYMKIAADITIRLLTPSLQL